MKSIYPIPGDKSKIKLLGQSGISYVDFAGKRLYWLHSEWEKYRQWENRHKKPGIKAEHGN